MHDITMCAHDGCPLGPTCRRNILVTKPKFEQPWAHFSRRPDGGCDHHLSVEPALDIPTPSGAAVAAQAVAKSYEGRNG